MCIYTPAWVGMMHCRRELRCLQYFCLAGSAGRVLCRFAACRAGAEGLVFGVFKSCSLYLGALALVSWQTALAADCSAAVATPAQPAAEKPLQQELQAANKHQRAEQLLRQRKRLFASMISSCASIKDPASAKDAYAQLLELFIGYSENEKRLEQLGLSQTALEELEQLLQCGHLAFYQALHAHYRRLSRVDFYGLQDLREILQHFAQEL